MWVDPISSTCRPNFACNLSVVFKPSRKRRGDIGEAKNNHHAGTWSQQSTTQSEQISQVNLCQFNDSAGVSLNSQGSSMNESTVSSQKVRQCSSISNKVRQFSEKLVNNCHFFLSSSIFQKMSTFSCLSMFTKVRQYFFKFVNFRKSSSICFYVR